MAMTKNDWSPEEEAQFQGWAKALPWHAEFQKQYNETPNLDDDQYDYRSAYKAGIVPTPDTEGDGTYHWPSSLPTGQHLKSEDHPTMWMEKFMQATGKDPRSVGVNTPEAGQAYLQRNGQGFGSIRQPVASEDKFFKENKNVGGYADFNGGNVVLNPYVSPEINKSAVYLNELTRLKMRKDGTAPRFGMTSEQYDNINGLKYYKDAPLETQMETLGARIVSGDPSGGTPTDEQAAWAKKMKEDLQQYADPTMEDLWRAKYGR